MIWVKEVSSDQPPWLLRLSASTKRVSAAWRLGAETAASPAKTAAQRKETGVFIERKRAERSEYWM
jgi:hypothetical protein